MYEIHVLETVYTLNFYNRESDINIKIIKIIPESVVFKFFKTTQG